ncbi:MAG: hypothetical protein JHC21_02465, partial [Thermocrinis sp.]|nr:hypothetical protein [Thermocrinis sp.]
MAKVRLEGAVKLEFEVKYGLDQDLVIKVHAIDVGNGKRVLIGEGEISGISDRTLGFIGDRIERVLGKDKSLVAIDGFGTFVEYYIPLKEVEGSREFHKAMYQ